LAPFDPAGLLFHGDEDAVFQPENCAAVLIAGGNIWSGPGAENALRYSEAMRWFSESTIGISLQVPEKFENTPCRVSAIDSLKSITVRDSESARILRQAGGQTPVLVCADLDYLQRVNRRIRERPKRKPVLGVVSDDLRDTEGDILQNLESDFEVRYVSASTFNDIDVCFTTESHGIFLSVLHEIPFAVIPTGDGAPQRECRALDYPLISDVREAWSERAALQAVIEKAKPGRLRLAQRNIDVAQSILAGPVKESVIEKGERALLVWAAPDEYWDEAQNVLAPFGSGFDCLLPADCRIAPPRSRKRMTVPRGTLMHWAMFPESLKVEIENQYDQTIVCHAFSGSRQHLADIAGRTARKGWEYRLWTHSCESYS
jgi:hypothetical protein